MTLELEIGQKLTEFVHSHPQNTLPGYGNMRIYDAPLIGIAAADDPYFQLYADEGFAGPGFIQPEGWLGGARSVISYFLPFTADIRSSNRLQGLPSEEWVSARIDGETFNNTVRRYLADLLRDMGADALAPCLDSRFKVVDIKSSWSERHIAFVSGLGTFGLHRALITQKGTAGRFGSVVTTMVLEPTTRDYATYYEYCLYLKDGKCGVCIGRCPPKAISQAGKDHGICSAYIDHEIMPRFAPRYGCAKCNIAVPCESGIPRNHNNQNTNVIF